MIKSKKQREKVIKREIKKEKKVKGFEFKLEISTLLDNSIENKTLFEVFWEICIDTFRYFKM